MMMRIMDVEMRVFHGFVNVLMFVVLGDVKPYTDRHQEPRHQQSPKQANICTWASANAVQGMDPTTVQAITLGVASFLGGTLVTALRANGPDCEAGASADCPSNCAAAATCWLARATW